MGRTIVLTTHYMDEAERLCDRIAIVDHGRVIALGTPRELVRSLGAEQVVELTLGEGTGDGDGLRNAFAALPGVLGVRADGPVWTLQVTAAHEALPAILGQVDRGRLNVAELRTHTPTLEDVFVSLTGRRLRDE
jgi:ABC-2 type transport system ATP-binding protein